MEQENENTENTGSENQEQQSGNTDVEKIDAATKRLEEQNVRMEQNLKVQSQMNKERLLSGNADAGKQQKVEDTDSEYAAKVMSGEIEPTN